jgi:RimJ/RimL family protein N-acetyltransferase
MLPITLITDRLQLRQWKDSDLLPLAQMCADPEVMRYFPKVFSIDESNAMAESIRSRMAKNGWGWWVVSLKNDDRFMGFLGLNSPQYELPFNPCIEIGWRLAQPFWGKGYATEAGREVLAFAFQTLELEEVVAFTALLNERSQRVMQRLGMQNTDRNFEHPLVPINHPLREHVLYKIKQKDFIY